MKQKNLLIVLMISLGFCFCTSGQGLCEDAPPNLEFRIGLQQDTFLVSQPIWLDLYMTNLGNEKVGVKPLTPASDWLKIIITNSENDTIPYKGEVLDWLGEGPTFTVQPKETLYICRNLLEGSGFGVEDNVLWVMGWSSLPEDTYRIKALYRRYLESNELSFSVVRAGSDQEKALELLKEGFSFHNRDSRDDGNAKWLELTRKYPSSVHAPGALRMLCYYDDQNSKKHAEKLLSTYPNSGYSGYAISVLLRSKTDEEKSALCQQVARDYQGTRAARFAKNIPRSIMAF
jgi:hypothetical protein